MIRNLKTCKYLYPLAWLYGLAVSLRNKLFDWGVFSEEMYPVPVISIGNITAGGTGKTPHIEFLINFLSKKYRVAVLSRGYKRKSSGFILADENVTRYFSKTIMLGDYYSLKKARKIIESKGFCPSKEKRLLDALELIATHKGIYKAREHFGDVWTKASFDRSLKELVALDINPVTIPRNWGYDYLPNLLKVYRGMKESSK